MSEVADWILTHAKICTADPQMPFAEAIAVRGSRILHVGKLEDAQHYSGSQTKHLDGQGNTLLPGLIDSHIHLVRGSLDLDEINLSQVRTLEDLRRTIHAVLAQNPRREWLVGRGLLYISLPGGETLNRHYLDEIVSNRPLIVFAYDTHTAWANTEALRRANLLYGRQTSANSQVVMANDGTAHGELREPEAYNLVLDLIPPRSEDEMRALLRKGLAQTVACGITSVHNMGLDNHTAQPMDGSEESLRLLLALEGQGELPLRVSYSMSVAPETSVDVLREFAALKDRYPSERVRLGAIKMFMDGVIESYTALLLEDYADQTGQRGGAHFSPQQFQAVAFEAERLGLQMIVHAIGDGAVRRALDGFAAVQGAHGAKDRRHRIEHIELIHPSDLPRFAELGVIASMQPFHVPMEAHGEDIWPRRVGEARWRYSFAWRDLRQSGACLIFGSDWPVVTQNPFQGFAAALNRPPWAPALPDQRQSLIETIHSYTHHAAFAEFQEHQKGMLRPGFLADMVLLSEDLFTVPSQEIARVHPLLTICNGRIVYQA